jgi:hypothetical protein
MLRTRKVALVLGFIAMLNSLDSTRVDAQASQRAKIETEIVELGRFGFYPNRIRRPAAGKHFLYVRDTTGIPNLTFRLEKQGAGRVKDDVVLRPGQRRLRDLLDLPAGRYYLSVVGHPDWVCELVIGGQP